MGRAGEWNVGQLVRENHQDDCVLIGFTTHTGTVTAASNWGGPAERKRVRPSMPGSYEALFHGLGMPSFALTLPRATHLAQGLREPMLERAIGVIYLPESELASHYFRARLSDQFDAVIHFDRTRAVEPLEPSFRGGHRRAGGDFSVRSVSPYRPWLSAGVAGSNSGRASSSSRDRFAQAALPGQEMDRIDSGRTGLTGAAAIQRDNDVVHAPERLLNNEILNGSGLSVGGVDGVPQHLPHTSQVRPGPLQAWLILP